MMELTVLVVDDEPLARRRLTRLLGKIDWVGRIEEAGDVDEAYRAVGKIQPDILLLDIQMPGGSGFDVLERLVGAAPPAVVFVTAFDHHALRAFEANAVDYITKPIEPGRFCTAMERARWAAASRLQADRIAELQETIVSLKRALNEQPKRASEFWVKVRDVFVRIAPENILRFQAERDYVRIHVAGADYLYQESLASLERRLDPADFVRIHRSTIVRRSAIVRIRQAPFAALIAALADGSEVRVGRTYAAALRARLTRTAGRASRTDGLI
ncbi:MULTISPECIES: LytR/AlgR family response regulator transcription factor [Methylomicrobium]|uniref:Response regulator of the LytR/AlgR family n=1 Tax=Methylomicrobium album BG8 TaxID=686340 RepID=H8GNE2_METAL|nr:MULTISPECIES: LytTR family DNA-binding domain-containing protein [Methylomicrobium]EIC28371.1 response regulator of the LytR/AlgR family [Methylomicrobium album BG8]